MAVLQRNRSTPTTALAQRSAYGMVPLSQAINRLFEDSFLLPSFFEGYGGFAGTIGTNVWETGDSYLIQIAMPGMKADSITATVEQGMLTITGEWGLPAPENARAIWESFGGQTEYRVALPGEVESGQAEATYENGVLTVRLPKPAQAQTHAIKVTAK